MSVFLRFQYLQTGIGLLENCVHLIWCESVRFNLCKNEVFRHFEQGLGHGIFLGRGGWQEQPDYMFNITYVFRENNALFLWGYTLLRSRHVRGNFPSENLIICREKQGENALSDPGNEEQGGGTCWR